MATKKETAEPAEHLFTIPKFKARTRPQIPKRIGLAVDLYYRTRATRLALKKVLEELQEQETRLSAHFIETAPSSQSTGFAGKLARVSVENKPVLRVLDWEKLYSYVKRHNAFEMLQRRLSDKAVRERLEAAGKRGLPGIGEDTVPVVRMNKL